jgi:hypothetical protein
VLQDARLPSQRQTPRSGGKHRVADAGPDPLAGIFDEVVVPMLEAAPGLRPIAIFEELRRRYPETVFGSRRTLERRIRDWRAMNGGIAHENGAIESAHGHIKAAVKDTLLLRGTTRADVEIEQGYYNDAPGLLLSWEDGSVFLAGVSSVQDRDLLFG